jgi:hypothetical protein
MNKNMFVSKMKLFGDTQKILAEELGLSLTRINEKINETNGAEFRMREIRFFRDRWSLTPEEVDLIFFTKKVS